MEYVNGARTLSSVCWSAKTQFAPQNTKALDSATLPPLERVGKPLRSSTPALHGLAIATLEIQQAARAMNHRLNRLSGRFAVEMLQRSDIRPPARPLNASSAAVLGRRAG